MSAGAVRLSPFPDMDDAMAAEVSTAWTARRALIEGAPATVELVALACGLAVRTLEARSAREGWTPAASVGERTARIARIHDRLLDRLERAQLQMEDDDGLLDKAGIAELSATARTLAKISEITRDEDGAKEKQLERDADIAAILERLDARIVELARHLAAEMACGNLLEAGAGPRRP